MLEKLPAELTHCTLQHLHAVDVANLARAVLCNHRLHHNIFLPCHASLSMICIAASRRNYFEKIFGPAQDFAVVCGETSCEVESCRPTSHDGALSSANSRRRSHSYHVRHEYHIAFLQLDDTLRWLPPADPERGGTQNQADYFAELQKPEKQMLEMTAAAHGLSIPASFFRLMSDARLMDRMPQCFWLLERDSIAKASYYISNGCNGYLIDFCHQSSASGTKLWSLWLEPGGSHCVVLRSIPSHTADDWKRPAAQLVGTSFELWLANAFYTHWGVCRLHYCFAQHDSPDGLISACLGAYRRYNSRLRP